MTSRCTLLFPFLFPSLFSFPQFSRGQEPRWLQVPTLTSALAGQVRRWRRISLDSTTTRMMCRSRILSTCRSHTHVSYAGHTKTASAARRGEKARLAPVPVSWTTRQLSCQLLQPSSLVGVKPMVWIGSEAAADEVIHEKWISLMHMPAE